MLVLNNSKKPYPGSPVAPSYLTLVTLKDKTQGHQDMKPLHLLNKPT